MKTKTKHLKSLPITIHASHKRMKKNSFRKCVENDKKELTVAPIISFKTRYLSSVPRTGCIWIYWQKSGRRRYLVAAGNSHFNNFENWKYRQRRWRKYSENRERDCHRGLKIFNGNFKCCLSPARCMMCPIGRGRTRPQLPNCPNFQLGNWQ